VLKIAYLVNHFPKVSHSFIRREILALERRGFDVLRIALRGWDTPVPDPADERERDRTLYVLRHGFLPLLVATLRVLVSAPWRFAVALNLTFKMARQSRDRPLAYHLIYLAEAAVILQWTNANSTEHLHAHFGTNSAEIAMLCHALGGPPYSFTVHGPDEFLRPMGLEEKTRRAVFVVAISHFGRSQMLMRLPLQEWSKVKIVRCALEPEFYAIPSRQVTDSKLIVCVGRLCEAKGQLLLIRAVASLAERGIEVELVLAGDGPLRSVLEREIDTLGIGRRVKITGWISSEQVREEILKARALVLPSFAEGLPVVIMEAMALRRPVLTTYVAGIPELVRPGESGWLFAAGSQEQLEAAIIECLETPVERLREFGDVAHTQVLAAHSIEIEIAKLAELLQAA
jgi:glycosyltransferase involved in cell wall biosynthesis